MNNKELTRGLATRLATTIPEIENNLRMATVDAQNMYDSMSSDILPITYHFGPLQLSVDEIVVRVTAEYQTIDQLGVDTLDNIHSVSSDMQQKLVSSMQKLQK